MLVTHRLHQRHRANITSPDRSSCCTPVHRANNIHKNVTNYSMAFQFLVHYLTWAGTTGAEQVPFLDLFNNNNRAQMSNSTTRKALELMRI